MVIGVVGSEEKAKLAKKNGCKHVLVRGRDEIAASVKKISKGLGAHVVYDGVGKDTFIESLDCLRRRGMMVAYGSASGPGAAVLAGRAREARLAVPRRGRRCSTTPSRAPISRRRARDLRGGEEGVDQGADPPALQAGRCRPGASRSRSPQDHGRERHRSLAT